jgi:hypothetical protein
MEACSPENADDVEHTVSSLCEKCEQGIALHDSVLSVHVRDIRVESKSMESDLPGLERLSKAIRLTPLQWRGIPVPLDYMIEDFFPDLPTLTDSAARGCQFCTLLKNCLSSEKLALCDPREQCPIQITFKFHMTINIAHPEDPGQLLLIGTVYLPSDDGLKCCTLNFGLQSSNGTDSFHP